MMKLLKVKRLDSRDWSKYANRASILTHFVYTESTDENYTNTARRAGTGDFNMLFTGDAFEAGLDETTITKDRKFDLSSVHTTRSVSDFSLHVSDGNILSWLWKQNLLESFRIDVLKVPHHGSSTTTSPSFYRFVSASVYLISASATLHNHPRAETLQAILATIIREDGHAKAPKEYYRDSDTTAERRNKTHIKFVCISIGFCAVKSPFADILSPLT
jgi:hypothetical protein